MGGRRLVVGAVRGARVSAVCAMAIAALTVAGETSNPVSAAAPQFGVASSMEQLRPSAVLTGRPLSASLVAARNETESFQVLIQGPATNVVVAGNLFGWGKTTVYRMADHVVSEPSDAEGATGAWRDALIPEIDQLYGENRNAFPVNVAGGTNLAVWVDVHVPLGTPAGRYDDNLQISSDGGSVNVPVSVEVLGLDLPSTSSLRSAFFMTYNGASDPVCLGHTGSSNCGANPALQRSLYSMYSRIALENRITIANGSGLRNDQSPANFPSAAWEDGYEAPVIAGTTTVPASANYRLGGARATTISPYAYASFHCLSACTAQWKAEAEEVASPFTDRFVLYGCDEPNNSAAIWASCATSLNNARSGWAAPSMVTATVGQYNTYAAANGMPAMQILIPPINRMHDRPGQALAGDQRSTYDSFLQTAGNEVWIYASCLSHGCGGDTFGSPGPYWNGWPGYAIDSPAVQQRAMAWMAWRYDASGELYYSADQRLDTAWQAGGQFEAGANGDGTLFYPGTPAIIGGTHHIPIESVRLKRIRDGREDYELMKFLDAHGAGAAVDQIVQNLFPTAYSAVPSLDGAGPGSLLSARDQLLELARAVVPPPVVGGAAQFIVYSSTVDGDDEIFKVPAAGGAPSQLTSNTIADRFPAWSPDGGKIAWTSGSDVWVMAANGGSPVNLTADIAAAAQKPAWTSDGTQIVFVRDADGGFTDIWKMNADGTNKTALVTYASGSINSYDPTVDNAGRVYFNLGEDLYRIGLDGSGFAPVIASAAVDEVVDIGPVSGRLTFSRSIGGQPYDVVTSTATGGSITNLTNRPGGNDFQSSWSPDESRIVFVTNRGGTYDLWTMNADGTGPVELIGGAGAEMDPDWGPARSSSTIGDFDGDGATDRGVFRPSVGGWYVDGQPTVFLGLSGDIPVPSDFDGDGRTDRAVYRSGTWFVDGQPPSFLGRAGDVPVPGDYNGDGAWERAVFRPGTGTWYVDGQAPVFLGVNGDVPVPGDYDGDGVWERAVFRPSAGTWYMEGQAPVFFGLGGDVPVPGDYDGDGVWDRAVFRPSVGGWYREGTPAAFYGLMTDTPVPGDFDGDGALSRAVFRPQVGGWYVEGSPTVFLGLPGDLPLVLPQAIYRAGS